MDYVSIIFGCVILLVCIVTAFMWMTGKRAGSDRLGPLRKKAHEVPIQENRRSRDSANDAYRRTVTRHARQELEQKKQRPESPNGDDPNAEAAGQTSS